MTERLKSFFEDRTVAEIKALSCSSVSNSRGLVDRIIGLDSENQGLVVRVELIPRSFDPYAQTQFERARKYLKHGPCLVLSQPETIEQALDKQKHSLDIRRRDFDTRLSRKRNGQLIQEGEMNALGYSFRPIQGPDKVKRQVPFARILDGARLFAYAHQRSTGIPVKPYHDAERVETEGAVAIVEIPSKREKMPRYTLAVRGIPVFDNPHQFAIPWSFRTSGERVPEHRIYNFGYKFAGQSEQSHAFVLDDKDVAASLGVSAHYLVHEHNKVPWEELPIAKPSDLVIKFDTALRNNVLIYDPTLQGKDKLRPPYIAERSILIGRFVALKGYDKTMFWEAGRDSKLTDYNWTEQEMRRRAA